jgi:DNA-binding NarL/FixJ family response regulator
MNRGRYKSADSGLTTRHCAVIALILKGCGNKEIGERLHYSVPVVKNICRDIYDVTGMGSKLEVAIKYAADEQMLARSAAALREWEMRPRKIPGGENPLSTLNAG